MDFKRFKKRLIGFLILKVYSEYRNETEHKIFIGLYFLVDNPKLRFFSLTFRTGKNGLGYYKYFGQLDENAMQVEVEEK